MRTIGNKYYWCTFSNVIHESVHTIQTLMNPSEIAVTLQLRTVQKDLQSLSSIIVICVLLLPL